ncbi:MAG: hypothetical protein H8E66_28230 [Planctomycetes bacterium]|nr:hypothetical protein [Planctomycetota bacterium]
MSSEVVVCPQCATNLQNSADIAGQIVACPQCQTQLQLPPLTKPADGSQLPLPPALPPAIELPPLVQPEAPSGSNSATLGSSFESRQRAASAADRLRRRSNPLLIVFVVAVVLVLIVVGTIGVRWDQAQKEKKQFTQQMVGNWDLVPGQAELERWDFAFHDDGNLQMALGNALSEGHWKVTSVRQQTGHVLIAWPDDAPETMRVTFESGTMRVDLDSVGNFVFRAAVP